jgi:hypothetical protein
MCCNSHSVSGYRTEQLERIVRQAQLAREVRNARRRDLYAQQKLVAAMNAPSWNPFVIDQPTKVEAPKERDLVLA